MGYFGGGPQTKRRRGPRLVPLQEALINLSKCSVSGQLTGDVVNVTVDHGTAHLFQSVDVGDPAPWTLNPELTVQQQRALPWPPQLQLSLEDAFFAAHALGCLCVGSEAGEELSREAFWQTCRRLRPGFAHLYAVLVHYRTLQGWFVRNGIDFGAHFVIYSAHRSEVHAEYCVFVRSALPRGGSRVEWREVSITNRVNVQVRKTLMVVNILEPPGLDSSTPACLKEFTIDERRVKRWTVADGVEALPLPS